MNKIIVGLFILFLASCSPNVNTVISKEQVAITLDDSYFDEAHCKIVNIFPNTDTLDGIGVADLINTLDSNNVTCFNTLNAIHQELIKQKAIIEKKPLQ